MASHHIVNFRSPYDAQEMLCCIDCADFMECGSIFDPASAEPVYQNMKLFKTMHTARKERFPAEERDKKTSVTLAIVHAPSGSAEARKHGEPQGCHVVTLVHAVGAKVWRFPVTTFPTLAAARAYVQRFCGEAWTEE